MTLAHNFIWNSEADEVNSEKLEDIRAAWFNPP